MRVLYEKGKIEFEEYLDYFEYLSLYRFRFLSIKPDDVEKAIFGDKNIRRIRPKNIAKLNLKLTLAEDYGVPFNSAFNFILRIFMKNLTDETILPSILKEIYIEIIESFPTELDKITFGKILLSACQKMVEKDQSKIIITQTPETTQNKIKELLEVTEMIILEKNLWTTI